MAKKSENKKTVNTDKQNKKKKKKSTGRSSEISIKQIPVENQDEFKLVTKVLRANEKIERSKPKVKKKKAQFFNMAAISAEIRGYGFEYTMKDHLVYLLIAAIVIILLGRVVFKLHLAPLLVTVVAMIVLMPSIVMGMFKYTYEYRRFSDARFYMETMLYEFKRKPKVLQALYATRDTTEEKSELRKSIEQAIAYIERGSFKADLYREALAYIEKKYDCERMRALHRFLAKIEAEGGEYQESVDVLLDDIKMWAERTYTMQQKRANVRTKLIMVTGFSLLLMAGVTYIVPDTYSITDSSIYQYSTAVAFILLGIIYSIAQKYINGEWLVPPRDTSVEILKKYQKALLKDAKPMQKKKLPTAIICIVAGLVVLIRFLVFGQPVINNVSTYVISIALIFLGVYTYIKPQLDIKRARKAVVREISKTFPIWLRDVAISLQKLTVHMAIKENIDTADPVLQPSLLKLLRDLDQDPVTIKPYLAYLKTFDLPEVQSGMKMLYSLNELGKENATKQINVLIQRNNIRIAEAENMEEDDRVGILGFIVALPMMVTIGVTLIDLVLIMAVFLNNFGNI